MIPIATVFWTISTWAYTSTSACATASTTTNAVASTSTTAIASAITITATVSGTTTTIATVSATTTAIGSATGLASWITLSCDCQSLRVDINVKIIGGTNFGTFLYLHTFLNGQSFVISRIALITSAWGKATIFASIATPITFDLATGTITTPTITIIILNLTLDVLLVALSNII